MNASLRYVFRNFGRRRLRTAAGALGIFLTIALLVAIQIGLDSVSTSVHRSGRAASRQGRSADHCEGRSPFSIQCRLIRRWCGRSSSRIPRCAGLAPRWVGIVQIQTDLGSQDVLLIGVDPLAEHEFDASDCIRNPNSAANRARFPKRSPNA